MRDGPFGKSGKEAAPRIGSCSVLLEHLADERISSSDAG
jgi:hypothetical protein